MKQYILSSFTANGHGGNKAAVVFDDKGLKEEAMKALARKNNFSETAFIALNESRKDEFAIRYYTPEAEVDICGHAALASFHVLKAEGWIKGQRAYHKTKAGRLKVIFGEDVILIEMKKPEIAMAIPPEEILDFTDLRRTDIVPDQAGHVAVVSTGLKDIIVEVASLEALRGMTVKKAEMADYCRKRDLVGMHVVSRETIAADAHFCCRNFAPAVGIDEESATGTSNASMLYYMLKRDGGFEPGKLYKVEQGYFMGSPSHIFVMAENRDAIYAGGRALIEKIEEDL